MMEELKMPKSLPKIITTAVGAVTMAYLLCTLLTDVAESTDDDR